MIWDFNYNGIYSVQSLYVVISFRGVQQIHTPVVWKLLIPPRVQVFLWLLCKNRILTRDNLGMRREVEENSCLFCAEDEIINHLFLMLCCSQYLTDLFRGIAGSPF